MAYYIESVVTPVPKKNLKTYRKTAKAFGKYMIDNGALSYFEYQGDVVPTGKWTSFPKAVKLKKDEVVFLALTTFKSKSDHKRIMKKMMKDPSMMELPMPFDGKRMIYGSFKSFFGQES